MRWRNVDNRFGWKGEKQNHPYNKEDAQKCHHLLHVAPPGDGWLAVLMRLWWQEQQGSKDGVWRWRWLWLTTNNTSFVARVVDPALPTGFVEGRTAGTREVGEPVGETDGPEADETVIWHDGWQESLFRSGIMLSKKYTTRWSSRMSNLLVANAIQLTSD